MLTRLCAQWLSCVQLLVTPWTLAHQAPLFMGFSRQEYWGMLHFPSGDLPSPRIKPKSPALQADSSPTEPSDLDNQLLIFFKQMENRISAKKYKL